jgi:hypothetical protein
MKSSDSAEANGRLLSGVSFVKAKEGKGLMVMYPTGEQQI